jgi:hypothetical protein
MILVESNRISYGEYGERNLSLAICTLPFLIVIVLKKEKEKKKKKGTLK